MCNAKTQSYENNVTKNQKAQRFGMTENELSNTVIGAAIEVHRQLGGPGLLEDIYEEALCRELQARGLRVERQVQVPVMYKGQRLKKSLCLDILVEDKLIIEVKAAEKLLPVFDAQLLTYLRLSGKKLGLLVNFGESRVSEGVLKFPPFFGQVVKTRFW